MPDIRRRRTDVPIFELYGEGTSGAAARTELLHIESVQSRSRRYRGEIAAHRHRGLHQVVWLGTGNAVVSLDDWRGLCEAPAAVVVAPGAVHAFQFAPDTEGHVLTLTPPSLVDGDPERAAPALAALFARSRVLAFEPGSEPVRRLAALFEAMLGEFEAPGGTDSPLPLWLARSVVWRLAQALDPQADPRDTPREAAGQGVYARFLALVERHYLDRWAVPRYARRLGLSAERLNRQLRAQCGRQALELIHERLAREARRRLIYLDTPVSRLAFELGFNDPAYFTRFFRRHAGLSPSEFRSRYAD